MHLAVEFSVTRFPDDPLPRSLSSAFPNKSIKPAFDVEAQPLVEVHGAVVSCSHSQAQGHKVAAAQFMRTERDQRFANPSPTMLRQHAYLGNMSYVFSHPRA